MVPGVFVVLTPNEEALQTLCSAVQCCEHQGRPGLQLHVHEPDAGLLGAGQSWPQAEMDLG